MEMTVHLPFIVSDVLSAAAIVYDDELAGGSKGNIHI
jgi:hypothetical protein